MHDAFWAKTTRSGRGWPYKPVAHHLADVAACALRFLELNPARLAREARLTGYPPSVHAHFCALAAALHDLGKLSKSFQFLCPARWPNPVLGACPDALPQTLRHWEATAVLLNAREVKASLMPVFGENGLAPMLIAAVAGHHGMAPRCEYVNAESRRAGKHPEIGPECVAAAAALSTELVSLFVDLRDPGEVDEPEAFSFALNGLVTLADWVGSDDAFFEFEDPAVPLSDYWPLALRRADLALGSKGLLPARAIVTPSLQGLSAHAGRPRPMQALAGAVTIRNEPQIMVIEDGTGSGKTEAAFLLAGRMMAAGLGEGVFVALPTMATANAMHGRLEAALGGLFDGNASLVLAHGKAGIARQLDNLVAATREDAGEQSEVRTWFNAWIADSGKKAFFASAGAGTIDQAFLSILPKKHLTMRQYALAGRILVVDEAHACDAYMGEELKTLAEMHARLGGSMIVLSATLARTARAGLVEAFALGRGVHPRHTGALREQVRSGHYPLFTRWSPGGGAEEIAVDGDPALSRSVGISRTETRADVVRLALDGAGRGAAVAIVCNAVDPAIETFEALLAAGHDPSRAHLFHARFTVEDRLGIEERVLAWFGRESSAEDRAGRILVATQVIEQSLDVDFDLMISDLAPADLVVQRAGRLWRHRRPHRPLAEPVLHLLTPDPASAGGPKWLEATLGPASFVYDMPGVMWRTARDLLAKGRLDTPADLRRLIETAYDTRDDDLPIELRAEHASSVGKGYAERGQGRHNTITPANGYIELTAPSADEDIGTRLGKKSLTIRLGRREGGTLVPLRRRPGAADGLNWVLSEIAVRDGWFRGGRNGALPQPADDAIVEAARSRWTEWEQRIPLYEVDPDGRLVSDDAGRYLYNETSGLRRIS
ncbi:MAG TPA: CRISPR-associated helicase Cas3' [Rhizobiales bacterium]|nr:CRISPR-associated helicase Cas3' [Hyphomicrobiales bacterium]